MGTEGITYVVGEEKGLREILLDSEVVPLLKGMVKAGADNARIVDATGFELWSATQQTWFHEPVADVPLLLEGEPVGRVQVTGDPSLKNVLAAMTGLLAVALNTVIGNNLKRILTTEIHTTVVNTSFEQLVEINRKLSLSENRYKELAESLEVRVQERTDDLKKAHAHLLQQEKMAAVGQLAAGVAHEINNPLGFITSNLHTLQKYVNRLTAMLDFYRAQQKLNLSGAEATAQTEQKWKELKVDMVCADLGDLLSQTLSGSERVSRIVADLKGFSHVDETGTVDVDVNQELERTLRVLSHQLQADDATVVRQLQPLPAIHCEPALLSQVFLNLVQNAMQAKPAGLVLTVATAWDGERIRISIADNGPGIKAEFRRKVFEPFFTTRPVGSGKGMGLAMVYDSVLKLGGTVGITDAVDGGADFIVTIPVKEG